MFMFAMSALWTVALGVVANSADPPSIIFILSDDLGYGDYSLSTEVDPTSFRLPTPNIARLAENGVKFSRGYSMQVCAPSRCTLMTGRHLGHCTIRGNDGAYTPLLPTDVSIAKVMKRAGYRTGLAGKWGLGNFNTSGYPLAQGFDYYVGQDTQVGCHDWYPLTISNNTNSAAVLNTNNELSFSSCLGSHASCTWMNDETRLQGLEFISSSVAAKEKYFLYLSTTTPHAGFLHGSGEKPSWYDGDYPVPYEYSQEFLNETAAGWSNTQRQFAAAVWAQDKIVGAVLDHLDALGTSKKTIVFFSGDNGPDGHDLGLMDDAGVFRGKKRSLHEGGIRQTIVAHWPGMITGSFVSDRIFTFYDVLPTAADLAGLPREQWGPTDGISIKDTLLNPTTAPNSDDRYIYFEFCHYGAVNGILPQVYQDGWVQAIRWDDNATTYRTEWKAIRSNSDSGQFLLYNITDDQSESRPLIAPNLSSSDPAVARARAIIEQQMTGAHVEDKQWKSSKSYADKCCNSCFTPGGCGGPCPKFGPQPPPPQPPAEVTLEALSGLWHTESGGKYEVSVDVSTMNFTVLNRNNGVTWWSVGNGQISATLESAFLKVTGTRTDAIVGKLVMTEIHRVIDVEYVYSAPAVQIQWADIEWPHWKKQIGPLAPVYAQSD